VVDLPEAAEDYQRQGEQPLQGTASQLPAPPQGVVQRRITDTSQQRFPGIVSQPRHWLRSSPDGSAIAFLMRDDQDVVQLWTASPTGGPAKQITHSVQSIQSAFSWHPQGDKLVFVCDNSLMLCKLATGELQRLTERSVEPPAAEAVVFSPDGNKVAFMRTVEGYQQIFVVLTI